MAEENKSKSAPLSILNDLTKTELILLVLSFSVATNIGLDRGFHVNIFHVIWSTARQTIPLGDVAIFLCLFGIFMTAGMRMLRYGLVRIYFELLPNKIFNLFSPKIRTPRADLGFVQREQILRKANRESDDFYLAIYQKREESDQEEWKISTHALCVITLLSMDWYWDRADSVAMSTWRFFNHAFGLGVASFSASLICLYLLLLFLVPIVRSEPDWVYCPGFPDSPPEDKLKVALGPPPPTPSLEESSRL